MLGDGCRGCRRLGRMLLLLGVALSQPRGAGTMRMEVDEDQISNIWHSLSGHRPIGLGPNASFEVSLRISNASLGAHVMLLNEQQQYRFSLYVMNLHNTQLSHTPLEARMWSTRLNYISCIWRASLSQEVINATIQVNSRTVGRYRLGVLQGPDERVEGLKGEVSFLNLGNGDPSQLEVQDRHKPAVVLLLAWAFFASAFGLAVAAAINVRGRTWFHGLLLATLTIKCTVLLLMRYDLTIRDRTGEESLKRKVAILSLEQIHKVCEVLIFYSIGMGWKVVRSHLRWSEWAFAGCVSGLSLLLGFVQILCTVFDACGVQSYLLTQFTVNSSCSLVVIIATNFNIFALQRQISEALASPDTSTLYAKHRAYSWFRCFFLYFVILPSLLSFLSQHVVRWDESWVIYFVEQASYWVIYSAVAWLFRPGLAPLKVFRLAVVDDDSGTDGE